MPALALALVCAAPAQPINIPNFVGRRVLLAQSGDISPGDISPGDISPGDISPGAVVPAPVEPAVDPLDEARFSLTVRNAPLARVLSLMATATGVQFRYAGLPDALVSARFEDARLLPALDKVLRGTGFHLRRSGDEIFVLRDQVADQLALASGGARFAALAWVRPAAWSHWTPPKLPPANWKVAQAPVVNQAKWKLAPLEIDAAQRPGVTVYIARRSALFVPNSADVSSGGQSEASALETAPVCLRWPMKLRFVPRGAQILLETPVEATFYVNGAPLLRRLKGKRLVDLSRVLQKGNNNLALYWPRVPRGIANGTGAVSSDKKASPQPLSSTPLLRYEWFFRA